MIRRRHGWWFLLWSLLAIGLVAPGCAGGDELPREAISGTVTLDSRPLAGGVIQFTPAVEATTGGIAVGGGSPIKDGQFSIDREHGLVPGSYKVTVNAAGAPTEPFKTLEPGRPNRAAKPKELIPTKYNAQTTLTAEVKKGGGNNFKFDLVSQ
jgi:hypothetical protein